MEKLSKDLQTVLCFFSVQFAFADTAIDDEIAINVAVPQILRNRQSQSMQAA